MCSNVDAATSYTITVTLSSQSTGWTALMFAVNEGHKDIVQRLVSAGADVHIRDKVRGDMESMCQMLHMFHAISENVVLWCLSLSHWDAFT